MDPDEVRRKRISRFQNTISLVPDEVRNPLVTKTSNSCPSIASVNAIDVSNEALIKGSPDNNSTLLKDRNLYTNHLICDVFEVTFSKDLYGKKNNYTFLTDVTSEFTEEGESNLPYISYEDKVETIIMNRLSSNKDERPLFQYLVQCYNRASQKNKDSADSNLIAKIQTFIVSFAGIVLVYPDMFPQPQSVLERANCVFADTLLLEDEGLLCITDAFLQDLIRTSIANDYVKEVFHPLLYELERCVGQYSFLDHIFPLLTALVRLCYHKNLLPVVVSVDSWDPEEGIKGGLDFERKSFLAAFIRLAPFPSACRHIAKTCFPDPLRKTKMEIDTIHQNIRTRLLSMQEVQYKIACCFLKGDGGREPFLNYISHVFSVNSKRRQMRSSSLAPPSSDGFLINLASILLRLCEPFMNPNTAKFFEKMDNWYIFSGSCRINLQAETCLVYSEPEKTAFVTSSMNAKDSAHPAHFITECFFLTAYCLHLGLLQTCVTYDEHMANIRDYQGLLNRLQEQSGSAWGPPEAEAFKQHLRGLLEVNIGEKYACDIQLFSLSFVERVLSYYALVCTWLIGLVDPDRAGLPLSEPSGLYKALPEFIIEDVVDYLLFVCRNQADLLIYNRGPLEKIIELFVLLLGAKEHLKNPHLRSKLAECMFMMTTEVQHEETPFVSIAQANPLALKFLVPSLISSYVEIEMTGSSNQFYEKFEVRFHLSIVLRLLWSIPEHRRQMINYSKGELFVRFVNLLMNDTTFLLDESLLKLRDIKETQSLMEEPEVWTKLPATVREERESRLTQDERQCRTFLLLAAETVSMFHYLTKEIVLPFLRPELVSRLAAMLNFNLKKLVGKDCQGLKVRNPEKLNFYPKKLLKELVDIYLQLTQGELSVEHPFVQAVGQDGRSYSAQLFPMAVRVLSKIGIDMEKVVKFSDLGRLVESYSQLRQADEEELGEVPEEFVDPLLYTVMSDPVRLPTSNLIVDRSTIVTHLLSDGCDPFNRKPLTIDQLESVDELKKKIKEWREKRAT
ncbi:ubiquitin conjugation factor E4 B-like isoform X2 [Zophobas morio]|uniref:ubiquitin conjugation factor E4 B-like isoform X2 n=1 Tax=Zophobas morio TaxID=2755281 RepID=UPI00308270AA